MDTKSDIGRWWIPDAPNQLVNGKITYGDFQIACIDVIGHLPVFKMSLNQKSNSYILWGNLSNGTKVTLLNCLTERLSISAVTSAKIISYCVIVGGHYRSLAEIQTGKILITYDGLSQWANISGLSFKYNEMTRLAEIGTSHVDDIIVGNHNDVFIKVNNSLRYQPDFHDIHVAESINIKLESNHEFTIQEALDIIQGVSSFISFGMTRVMYPKIIRIDNSQDKSDPHWIELYLYRVKETQKPCDPALIFYLFALPDIISECPKML